MRYTCAAMVDAPIERVWAWWTDFGEPGESFQAKHGAGSSTRTILSREGDVIVFRDKTILGDIKRTVRLASAGHSFVETGEGGQTYESQWRFEDAGDGRTRVVRDMRVRGAKLLAPFARWVTAQDLRYHCREATRELRAS